MLYVKQMQITAAGFADKAAFAKAVSDHIAALTGHTGTVGAAAPVGLPLVEQAIERVQNPGKPDAFVAAYQFADTLDDRKALLVSAVHQEAGTIIAAVVPPLKANHWHYQVMDAQAVDEGKRTAAQRKVIADHLARQAKVDVVSRHAARMASDIHDLTDATIDGWKAEPFPT